MKEVLKTIKNKLYNYRYIILIFVFFFALISIRLPFIISAPGGITNLNDKFEINGINKKYEIYYPSVSEYRANIPLFLYAKLKKNWDITPLSDYDNDISYDEDFNISKDMLNESNKVAAIYAYNKAKKQVTIKSNKLIVSYVSDEVTGKIMIGDEILAINDTLVNSFDQLKNITSNLAKDDEIILSLIRNKKNINVNTKIIEIDDEPKIGVVISEEKEIATDPEITFDFDSNEAGPSGSLMMALSIYNELTDFDITKGLKIVGSGAIDSEGNALPVGGIKYKFASALKAKANIFFVPAGDNFKEAQALLKETDSAMMVIGVKDFDSMLGCLGITESNLKE